MKKAFFYNSALRPRHTQQDARREPQTVKFLILYPPQLTRHTEPQSFRRRATATKGEPVPVPARLDIRAVIVRVSQHEGAGVPVKIFRQSFRRHYSFFTRAITPLSMGDNSILRLSTMGV